MTTTAKKTGIKTFNVSQLTEPVKFAIDDDEFEAIPPGRLPAGVLATYFHDINDGKLFEAQAEFFKTVLKEESHKLFTDRLNSQEKPIPITILGDVASWLLGEVYMAGNPTEESK